MEDLRKKDIKKLEEETLTVQRKLIGNPDAKIWAEEFVKAVNLKPIIATDEGTMIGWFANAIMAGYDHAKNKLNFIQLEGGKNGRKKTI